MSNSNAVVDVQGISKSYELDALRYSSLRESVNKLLLNPFRKNQRAERKQQNTVWALQDVTFSLDAGDVLGIVGHNGSGKSTLLKILSRVIKPTTGSGTIKGQVISLLEVGTGFHPELTGHENIFFSGNLLNLPDEKIHENYDAILEFANIGRYISVPVKHYSSGMRVRLAFAIAALCKPDILITDEVLQVGDKDFRDKSLRVIQEMIEEESTVIISSHSTSLLSELCNRVLWLDHGQVIHYGDVDALTVYEEHRTFGNVGAASQDNTQRPDPEIVAEEIQALKEQRRAEQEQRQAEEAAAAAQAITEAMEAAEAEQEATDTAEEETPDLPTGRVEFHPPLGDEYARLVSLDIVNTHGESVSRVNYNEDAYIHVKYDVPESIAFLTITAQIITSGQIDALRTHSLDLNEDERQPHSQAGIHDVKIHVPKHLLAPRTYELAVGIWTYQSNSVPHERYTQFEVIGDIPWGAEAVIRPQLEWSHQHQVPSNSEAASH